MCFGLRGTLLKIRYSTVAGVRNPTLTNLRFIRDLKINFLLQWETGLLRDFRFVRDLKINFLLLWETGLLWGSVKNPIVNFDLYWICFDCFVIKDLDYCWVRTLYFAINPLTGYFPLEHSIHSTDLLNFLLVDYSLRAVLCSLLIDFLLLQVGFINHLRGYFQFHQGGLPQGQM